MSRAVSFVSCYHHYYSVFMSWFSWKMVSWDHRINVWKEWACDSLMWCVSSCYVKLQRRHPTHAQEKTLPRSALTKPVRNMVNILHPNNVKLQRRHPTHAQEKTLPRSALTKPVRNMVNILHPNNVKLQRRHPTHAQEKTLPRSALTKPVRNMVNILHPNNFYFVHWMKPNFGPLRHCYIIWW